LGPPHALPTSDRAVQGPPAFRLDNAAARRQHAVAFKAVPKFKGPSRPPPPSWAKRLTPKVNRATSPGVYQGATARCRTGIQTVCYTDPTWGNQPSARANAPPSRPRGRPSFKLVRFEHSASGPVPPPPPGKKSWNIRGGKNEGWALRRPAPPLSELPRGDAGRKVVPAPSDRILPPIIRFSHPAEQESVPAAKNPQSNCHATPTPQPQWWGHHRRESATSGPREFFWKIGLARRPPPEEAGPSCKKFMPDCPKSAKRGLF